MHIRPKDRRNGRHSFLQRRGVLLLGIFIFCLSGNRAIADWTETQLHVFDDSPGDSAYPVFGPVLGPDGAYYGTAVGGSNSRASIFRVSADGLTYTTLHHFNPLQPDGTNVGGGGVGPIVLGKDGNFYGVTGAGGPNGTGTIFSLTPSGSFNTIYNFDAATPDHKNTYGVSPVGLIVGNDGAFYGAASNGGPAGFGTVFRITTTGDISVIASFDQSYGGLSNPSVPVFGPDGNLYGAGKYGGASGAGGIYKIDLSTGQKSILYSFTLALSGRYPTGLVLGQDGNFYGVTMYGGAYIDNVNQYGTIFRVTPQGAVTLLYTFLNDLDGGVPQAIPTVGNDGTLYGTAVGGGPQGAGTAYKLPLAAFSQQSMGSKGIPGPASVMESRFSET